MKKIVIASLVALIATTASASPTDSITIAPVVSKSFAGNNTDYAGIEVGKHFKSGLGINAGFARDVSSNTSRDMYSVGGTADVAKFGGSTLYVESKLVHVDSRGGANGLAVVAGFGVEIPLSDKVSVKTSLTHQQGQDSIKSLNGNGFSVKLVTAF